jgi:endo-1,4-beta-xylanase
VSTRGEGVRGKLDMTPMPERLAKQARLVGEAAEAFTALPAHQRYAFTVWGLRDKDSWLRHKPDGADDRPLLFDDAGRPKPAARALVEAVSRG